MQLETPPLPTHEAIRTAWQREVEDPGREGVGAARLAAAVRRHGDPGLLSVWSNLLTGSPGASGALPGDAGAVEERLRSLEDVWRVVLDLKDDALGDLALQAFTAAQNGSLRGFLAIATMFARVGFATPEATIPVHEAIADGWLRGKAAKSFLASDWNALLDRPFDAVRRELDLPPPSRTDAALRAEALRLLETPVRLPDGLADAFWEMVGTPVDPATITPRIAAFGSTYDDRLKESCARAILHHADQREIANQPWPPRIRIESLSGYAPGSLGHALYHLIVDNGYDPEVLDPDTVTGFHPGLDGTNRRILQQHEIWHLVAGYSTSALHETAISSFQLAQFGHNYSAIFLATVTSLVVLQTPAFADPLVQVMCEAWRHGRTAPPLMSIDWPALWERSVEEIRTDFGIAPFRSAIPDLFAPSAP